MSETFFWFSFADNDTGAFLGGVLVRGGTLAEALKRSKKLGLNPGGEVLAVGPLPREVVPDNQPIERLMSLEELASAGLYPDRVEIDPDS